MIKDHGSLRPFFQIIEMEHISSPRKFCNIPDYFDGIVMYEYIAILCNLCREEVGELVTPFIYLSLDNPATFKIILFQGSQ